MEDKHEKLLHPAARIATAATALALVGCAVTEKAQPTMGIETPSGSNITEVAVPETTRISEVTDVLKGWKSFNVNQNPVEMVGEVKLPLNADKSDVIFLNPAGPDGSPNPQVEYMIVETTLSTQGKEYPTPFVIKIDKTANTESAYMLQFSSNENGKMVFDVGQIDQNKDVSLAPFQFVMDSSTPISSFYLLNIKDKTEQPIVSAAPTAVSEIADVALKTNTEPAPISLTPTAEVATATPETPATPELQISQDLAHPENLPSADFEYLTSPEFAQWVLDSDKAGKFPEVPDTAVPLKSVTLSFKTDTSSKFAQKYGWTSLFDLTRDDYSSGVYKDKNKHSWIPAAAWKTEFQGEQGYAVLAKYQNNDNTHGFWLYITPKANVDKYPVVSGWPALLFAYSSSRFPNGEFMIDCAKITTAPNLCEWSKSNQDISVPKQILDKFSQTGIVANTITVNGKETRLIPVTISSSSPSGY